MNVSINLSPAFLRINLYKVRFVLVGKSNLPEVNQVAESVKFTGSQDEGSELKSKRRYPRVKKTTFYKKATQLVLSLLIAFSFLMAGVYFGPKLFYQVVSPQVKQIDASEEGSPIGGDFNKGIEEEVEAKENKYVPPHNPNLPEGTWLIIPRISIRTQMELNKKSDEALETGLWLVPDYGMPGDAGMPMIVAGHRYGWDWWWQDDYWRYHSFYLLTQLEPGDTVEAIHDQRKWVYEIYAGEEGTEISDYNADLILYTCKFLNSPIRHFRYARLIDPTKNTQE